MSIPKKKEQCTPWTNSFIFLYTVRFLNCKYLLCRYPKKLSRWFSLSHLGTNSLPLCGRSFWESCPSWGFPLTPEDSDWLFLPEAFCNSAQRSFSFSHTAILCINQFDVIHHVMVGLGGCHFRLPPWSEGNLRASLAHDGVPGVQCAWPRVEYCVLAESEVDW